MHCSLVKSCSPRRASPGILLAPSALQATAAPTAITRTMNIAGLLFNHFEAGHENVDPEPLVPVQLLAVAIPAPLGVPLYVLLEGKGKASQRLVVARGPRTVGDEERSAGGDLGSDAGHRGQDRTGEDRTGQDRTGQDSRSRTQHARATMSIGRRARGCFLNQISKPPAPNRHSATSPPDITHTQ